MLEQVDTLTNATNAEKCLRLIVTPATNMKLIKGSKSKSIDNSNPHYDPKVFRGSKKEAPKGRSKSFVFSAFFIALILVLTAIIERYWVPH